MPVVSLGPSRDGSREKDSVIDASAISDLVMVGPRLATRAVLVAITCLPVVVAAIRAIGRGWVPIGDSALLYTRAADVLTRHHPFLGSWTSASVTVGENMKIGPGAALGVGALNVATIIGISAASRHIGGWPMQRWMLAGAAALAWSMGSELLIDILQAHALLLPFFLFLILLTGCSTGIRAFLPFTAGVATLLIQTHITYAYILSLLVVISMASFWWTHRPLGVSRIAAGLKSREIVYTALTLIVLWAHPIWEQFFGEGRGNLTRLLANAGGGPASLGVTDATRITGGVMTAPWWWTRHDFPTKIRYDGATQLQGLPTVVPAAVSLLVLVVLLGTLAVVAAHRGLVAHAVAGAISALSVPAAIVSLSRLTIGPTLLSSGHVRWLWPLAVFITFVVIWIVVDLWSVWKPRPTSAWSTAVAAALVVGFSTANLTYAPQAGQSFPQSEYAQRTLRRVLPRLDLLAGQGPVLYQTANVPWASPYITAVWLRMRELDIEFRVSDEVLLRQLGTTRRADGSERVEVFQLEGAAALNYCGPACTIALSSALSEQGDARAASAARDLAAALVDGTIRIDRSRLTEGDPAGWVLDFMLSGDLDIARSIVMDDTLNRWLANGVAVTSNRAATEQRLDLVKRWVDNAYGLFAEGFKSCPTDGDHNDEP